MTSMRIDGDKIAKVWGKRLKNFVKAAEADGCEFFMNPTTKRIAIAKDGKGFDDGGEDVTEGLFG